MLEHKGGLLRRWKMARQAERLNTMRLDVTELAERTDNAIKFLSDKLRSAGDLYQVMVDEFHQARAFVLEVLVVAILVIELIDLFTRGRF